MSFELKPEQSLRKNVRRIVRKQMEDALEMLTGGHEGPRDGVVHDTRKCFKRVRAALRLVRPKIGEKAFRAENLCFRDAARPLTEVRDARILIETLDGLVKHFHDHIRGKAFADIRKALQANLTDVRKRVLDDEETFTSTGEVVRQALGRIKGWASMPDRWPAIGQGLEDTYRKASASFEKAAADTNVLTLHEWRKQVKYLRYQLEMLRPLWPERMEELAGEADRMGELLGDDHDLAVLRQTIADDPARFGDEGDREMLLALIDRRRADLEQETILLGRRFFQDGPRKFARRLRGYWKAWRNAEGREQPAEAGSARA
jgi:CHAD domain-containing protein